MTSAFLTNLGEVHAMRVAITAAAALAMASIYADEVAMKNGENIVGNVQGLKEGQLDMGVSAGYFGGFPAQHTKKLRFSNVRSIKFDGRDDYFSIIRRNKDLTFGYIRELSRGKFTVDGHDLINVSSVKALVPSKPNAEEKN